MNKILVWSVFFIISITLGLTIFEPNTQNNSNEKININNHVITENDLSVAETIIKKKNLNKFKNINEFDKKLRKILINNLKTNNITDRAVTHEEIIQTITNDPKFKKEDSFDFNLYQIFLTKNNISEYSFQKFIERKIKRKKFKHVPVNTTNTSLRYKKIYLKPINNLNRLQSINAINLNLVNYLIIRPYLFHNYLNINNEIILNTLLKNERLYKKTEILKINHLKINKRHKKYNIIKNMLLNNNKYIENILNNKKTKKNILLTQDELNIKFKTKIYIDKNIFIKESNDFLHIIQIIKHNNKLSYDYKNDIQNKYIKINKSILKNKFVLVILQSTINNLSNNLKFNVHTGHTFLNKNKYIMIINPITDVIFEKKTLVNKNIDNYLSDYFKFIKLCKNNIYNLNYVNKTIYFDYINKMYYVI